AAPDSKAAQREARAEALRLADAWLDAVRAYNHLPALSAAVEVGDELVWAKGYGAIDPGGKVPASSGTIYSICSISKLFTSVAVMQQFEAGRVRLDEPVTTYLPWAKLKSVDAADSLPISLRAMLTHSAGLPRESDSPYWTGPDFLFPSREQVRETLTRQEALYPVGRYFQYSNLGLTLVGETVEAVSGEPYAAYVQAHVLGPLGLTDTHPFMPMALYEKRLAAGFGPLRRDGTRELLRPFDARGVAPAAGYTSTVEDMARFAAWQFRLLRTGKPEVLKASTLREMQRVQFVDPDWKTNWGLGFSITHMDRHTFVGHGGACPGYQSALMMEPATETAVVVMDNASENPDPYAAGVFALLAKRGEFKFKDPQPAQGVNLEAYSGRYASTPWRSEGVMTPWAGGLAYLSLPTPNPADGIQVLKPKGGDVFRRVRDDGSEAEEYRFERNAAGKVTRFIHFNNPTDLIGSDSAPPAGRKSPPAKPAS
ncbi:MAG TPA: serine hydrolase domain-containing protein, partial [Phenylobacterium sp.]|nr:serine hydrolase domain-containing protein [Phenylobacterium sp.]